MFVVHLNPTQEPTPTLTQCWPTPHCVISLLHFPLLKCSR